MTIRVCPCDMERVYQSVRTPFKQGIVLRGAAGEMLDSPSVFRQSGTWYMMYIAFDGQGYETRLARSMDLLHWEPLGVILSRRPGAWDSQQAAGYSALQDNRWDGTWELQPHDGKYWMSYLGGALTGYETDPLSIGMAHTADPSVALEWTRLPAPVLTADQDDARPWEKRTLYKSNIIRDETRLCGAPFVMFYNAKTESGYERIGLAVSDDLRMWRRYGAAPVIDHGHGLCGDPQVVRIGDLWVMFYFGAFWHGRPAAFETFACSRDLTHWTPWDGPELIAPNSPWDAQYAHKPWVVRHEGTVYHFYCAVGNQGRCIALATSRDIRHHQELNDAC